MYYNVQDGNLTHFTKQPLQTTTAEYPYTEIRFIEKHFP